MRVLVEVMGATKKAIQDYCGVYLDWTRFKEICKRESKWGKLLSKGLGCIVPRGEFEFRRREKIANQ
jgi:hypothetical protein